MAPMLSSCVVSSVPAALLHARVVDLAAVPACNQVSLQSMSASSQHQGANISYILASGMPPAD